MLSQITCNESYSTVTEILKSGVKVSALPGTPLAVLVDANLNSSFITQGNLEPDVFAKALPEISMTIGNSGKSEHDLVKAEIVESVFTAVAASRDLARNTAVPLINNVIGQYNKYANEVVTSAIGNINVVPVFYHDVWQHPSLDSLIEAYPEQAIANIPVGAPLAPIMSAGEVLKSLETGMLEFDAMALDFASNQSDYAMQIFNCFFTRTNYEFDNYASIFNGFLKTNRSAGLLVFLWAKHFSNNIPSGIDYELSAYKLFLAQLCAQGANFIRNVRKDMAEDVRAKQLVLGYPAFSVSNPRSSDTFAITVNGSVYNQWIEAGGVPEILMGAAIDSRDVNYDSLLANATKYVETYNAFVALRASVIKEQVYGYKVKALNKAFYDFLQSEPVLVDGPSADMRSKYYNDRVATLSPSAFDDTEALIRDLVCETFFGHTAAKRILTRIETLSKENPEKDVKEVAAMAFNEYVTDWVMQFITFERA